ncbi:transcriptional adapter 2-alpha [Ischnura elegans]|uniref:transcriptional adapter 2-alpha n=1 Tax=Ischnura elegans TaxID=197161 RepID=UPI001ED89C96|nr:transcriptional adapter 2-alpha [Ischnura elegans]XP_046405310.1 transcriptional adapter 2-alpha [Ischnura elegans]XP_046405311.1 transcriptional adapter 2-alpha [Ischnura elegans]XP_046405313.1 transcriptional adapter 2-alpha [Ischnura elegans]
MAVQAADDIICCGCSKHLREVYGYCVVCSKNTVICQQCIANGVEFGSHKNSHSTLVMRVDLAVLEDGWTASDEFNLLDALLLFGPNDWESVRKYMGSVLSAQDVKEHYVRVYQNDHLFRIDPSYIPNRVSLHDPPRFTPASILHSAFSGYNAARGDFQTDYDNDAEQDLSVVDSRFIYEPCPLWNDEDRKLGSELFFAIIDNYNRRLEERKRRHEIIGEHGLIQPQKNFLWLRRFDDSNMHWGGRGRERQYSPCPGVSSQMIRILTKFAQYFRGLELDKLFEGLKFEADLRSTLNELYELRRNGITNFHVTSIYHRYCQRQEDFMRERRKYLLNPFFNWKNSCDGRVGKFPHLVNQCRRPAPPLNISKLPGCDKLTAKERELCSVARIVPDSFLEFKNILVAECLKQGGLRLVQARSLIKIDVNKTRKLYDFLLEEGVIYQGQ